MNAYQWPGLALLLLFAGCAEKAPKRVNGETLAADSVFLDLHDVKDLTIPIQSFPGCNGLCDCERDENGFPAIPEPDLAFEGDDLADLIRGIIDPEIWSKGEDSRGGCVVAFREGGVLLVKAPAATHARIGMLLAAMRKAVPIPESDSGR